jgi:6-phosphogluconolactonase (cycloisomerase 2 family)
MKTPLLSLAAASLFAVGCADTGALDVTQEAEELRVRGAGAVYTLSNDPAGNAVVVYRRARDGSLSASATVRTGGRGTGAGLGSQGALVLSENRRWLFAVNAGSNDVSSFRVFDDGLSLVSVTPSGGVRPVSVTSHGDLVYVLNADGAGNVSGFRVARDGALEALAGSTRSLSGAATTAPAQVQFDPEGDAIVVTEKATSRIDTFNLYRDGTRAAPRVLPSAAPTPFGFAFNARGYFVVSEAANAVASSYTLTRSGAATVVSAAVPDGRAAPCWVAIPRERNVAYVANAASNDISTYRIDARGRIALAGDAVSTGAGSHPTDMAITPDDEFLYVLNDRNGTVGAFRIGADGAITSVGAFSGLPATPVGLAAR